jgi:hypothetical protein
LVVVEVVEGVDHELLEVEQPENIDRKLSLLLCRELKSHTDMGYVGEGMQLRSILRVVSPGGSIRECTVMGIITPSWPASICHKESMATFSRGEKLKSGVNHRQTKYFVETMQYAKTSWVSLKILHKKGI